MAYIQIANACQALNSRGHYNRYKDRNWQNDHSHNVDTGNYNTHHNSDYPEDNSRSKFPHSSVRYLQHLLLYNCCHVE
ncbi:MAG: hypothetical protein DHS20C17_29880 [Cyclobacteriaceae bacterium]|nr:MAG: hypothetical protein DHS20C17_29880 [Cyclobacteriaceae bacterium]